MRIDWWTLGLQTINLLVLLWLLGRFLFRPMARIVAARQQEAARLLDDAHARRAEAEEAARTAQNERDAAVAQRDAKLKAARAEAEAARASLLETAHQEARRIEDDAKVAIDHMRAEGRARTDRDANALAADIAARLLARPAERLSLTGFLDGFETALASLPEEARARIAANGAPLQIRVAREPSGADLAALDASLSTALGRKVAFDTKVDPTLIGGLALDAEMASVNNSLRTDLNHVLADLNGHDAG